MNLPELTYDQVVLLMWVLGLWSSVLTACMGICLRYELQGRLLTLQARPGPPHRRFSNDSLNSEEAPPPLERHIWTPNSVASSSVHFNEFSGSEDH